MSGYIDDVRVCPGCGCKTSKILDCQVKGDYVDNGNPRLYRRRQCQSCGVTWATYEIHASDLRNLEKLKRLNKRVIKMLEGVEEEFIS